MEKIVEEGGRFAISVGGDTEDTVCFLVKEQLLFKSMAAELRASGWVLISYFS